MSQDDQEKLIHAFVSSRLDYCNGLLTGISQKNIKQLQLIQNAAARVLTGTKRFQHITPVLKTLHWLPVKDRIDFKVLLLMYKSQHGQSPDYISEMFSEYKPKKVLRSMNLQLVEESRVKSKHGEAAFSHHAARKWNRLPVEIQLAPNVNIFKSKLKTFLFACAYGQT